MKPPNRGLIGQDADSALAMYQVSSFQELQNYLIYNNQGPSSKWQRHKSSPKDKQNQIVEQPGDDQYCIINEEEGSEHLQNQFEIYK